MELTVRRNDVIFPNVMLPTQKLSTVNPKAALEISKYKTALNEDVILKNFLHSTGTEVKFPRTSQAVHG